MVYLVYTLLCLIWGSTWMAIKLGLEDSPPFWSAGLRFVIAGIIILLAGKVRRLRYPSNVSEILQVSVPGIFMYGLSYMLVYWAMVHVDSALTAMLFASLPFFVAAFSIKMLKDEKLGLVGWLGLIVGFSGIVLIFYDSLLLSRFVLFGVILIVIASAAAAYGTVYIRARLREYNIAVMAGIQMSVGALMIITAAIVLEPLSAFKLTTRSVGALLYLSLFGSILAFLCYYWLLKRIRAVNVSQIAFITPIVAFALGSLVLGEVFTIYTFGGSILILAGVILVVRG
jgi:drug/metabolite transporter (DMT)-like permease